MTKYVACEHTPSTAVTRTLMLINPLTENVDRASNNLVDGVRHHRCVEVVVPLPLSHSMNGASAVGWLEFSAINAKVRLSGCRMSSFRPRAADATFPFHLLRHEAVGGGAG